MVFRTSKKKKMLAQFSQLLIRAKSNISIILFETVFYDT